MTEKYHPPSSTTLPHMPTPTRQRKPIRQRVPVLVQTFIGFLLVISLLWISAPSFRSTGGLSLFGLGKGKGQQNLNLDLDISDIVEGKVPLTKPLTPGVTTIGKKRIAIIGAGASGSSAAFWLSRAVKEVEGDIEIVVFDKLDYVGGRSTTVQPENNEVLPPVELGASVFVPSNKNLFRAVDEFGLTLVPWKGSETKKDSPKLNEDVGIWDGKIFQLITQGGIGWWDKLKLVWRYGFTSPQKTSAVVSTLLNKFNQFYKSSYMSEHGPWESVESMNRDIGFDGMTGRVLGKYLEESGVGKKWVEEMVEAFARVNYAQDSDSIHALVGMVSMATSGATSVLGGNWKIFEGFLKHSGAKVSLDTEVNAINHTVSSKGQDQYYISATGLGTAALTIKPFDAVFLATPYDQSNIIYISTSSNKSLSDAIPPQPYIHLHVTLLATTSTQPNALPFGLKQGSSIPTTILTTSETYKSTGKESDKPDFQSITYHGEIEEGSGVWIVKIFSMTERTDEWINAVFGEESLSWVYRKLWQSYPVLPPTETFPPIKPLGESSKLFYLPAYEPWISTMETQTLSSRNAVGLLVKEWWGLGMGVCDGLVEGGWDWTC